MEDYRLPASLVGMLKATRLTGIPRIQTDLQTATLAVTITWELASSNTKKTTTKPPASKKTAPAKKKSPSPSTKSSTSPKSSTPPSSLKPTPPPSPKPAPSPPKPKPSPKPTPPSPKKANRLHENVQRLTKAATQRLARQGGLTSDRGIWLSHLARQQTGQQAIHNSTEGSVSLPWTPRHSWYRNRGSSCRYTTP